MQKKEGDGHLSEAQEAGFGDIPSEGVFILQGQTLSLSPFTISVTDDGGVKTSEITISMTTHMTPHWLSAAIGHARDAERLSHQTNQAFRGSDGDAKGRALDAELTASMQAITCAAFALEALHATLLKVQPTPKATLDAWRKNRTKRSRQMFETIRRAFKFGPKSGQAMKTYLDQITDARDKAVHPPSKGKPAERHPRLPIATDPAFCIFRARNAIVAVGMAFELIEAAATSKNAKVSKVAEEMVILLGLIGPVSKRWRRTKVGKIFKILQKQREDKSA